MYHVYILTNKIHTVLYIGVTSNLVQRLSQHRRKSNDGFTKRYNITKLIYFEEYSRIEEAILREKRLKKWKRAWKEDLINKRNPKWNDLSNELKLS